MTDAAGGRRAGRIVRVNGPLVEVEGLEGLAILELVRLGPHGISGETISVTGTRAIVQAYEYTGGLACGDRVDGTGSPLAGLLGPGLLGGVFDGLLRPLSSESLWLTAERDEGVLSGGVAKTWNFSPTAALGNEVSPGDLLGVITGSGSLEHRVLVPSTTAGEITWVSGPAPLRLSDPVARVGEREVALGERWPIRRARPFRERTADVAPLHTGQRVLDLMFPLPLGAAAAVPGGFGTGKTLLLQQIAKWSSADVIVYVGCGERGNEMADVLAGLSELEDIRTGGRLIDRTVIIANTSNMPMMAREASVYTGLTVAEYFRDMGYDALVIADSTSRWAEALREFANRNGELPAEEGYPASLASNLAAFYERAGRVVTLGGRVGSVTVVGAVSPPGGDMTEPVTTDTERFVRSLWLLDPDLAYARHYPAVSWSGSFTRDLDAIAVWHGTNGNEAWASQRTRASVILSEADRLAALAEVIGTTSLPGHERVTILGGRLLREGVLRQNALSRNDGYCSTEKGIALLGLALAAVDTCHELIDRGVSAATIEQADYGLVLRAAEETASDDAAGVVGRQETLLRRLAELA
ncbi:ATPase [Sinomonas humi]|uniref:ATPase n=1 Tax=Sinomonas humi TaxID=1338436 RepID=A0A0B2AQL3_9MICC|nr:ATPase [Sinomonas humi]